jgi:alpha-2-macroglobulin
MFAVVRAGLFAALALFACCQADAAEKPFQREELADAAIRLEAEIKHDAGRVEKSAAVLRREAEDAFQSNDYRNGLQLLGKAVTAAPNDSATWLRLARAILQIGAANDRERALLLERASTAAYIAYQRTSSRSEEADSLVILGRTFAERKLWRPALDALRLSLELREAPDVRVRYEQLRAEHGFRLLDYSVDAEASSPRACFQFSEALPGKRTDFSPFVAVSGIDRPALSVDNKQLCVEGLKHGEGYTVTLRAGLPSVVKETLAKSAEFTIYVRDRQPFVRFTGKNYVLPRSGQRGIPIISVNTSTVAVEIYRISDRSLIDAVIGGDFQRNLDRYEVERLAAERAATIWKGKLAVEQVRNSEVTTAFPIDQTVGDLAPGVYVMVAAPQGPKANDYDALATQWFIVSDLGLTAYSGDDGIHVFVHSLSTADPEGLVEVRLVSRSNEILATHKTEGTYGSAHFEPGLTRGEGGAAPALLVATDQRGDYAFLSLKTPPFDLSDRGVIGRVTPAGLDAFVYTERGVYRSGETVHVTALLRDARGMASLGVPLTLVVERPDGVEYRRAVVADQGVGGHSLNVAITPTAATGTWRVRAYTDPKGAAVGETTFMVEDYVPDRLEFDLSAKSASLSPLAPAQVSVSGRYLYGAPAAKLNLEGEIVVSPARERPGFAGYRFGPAGEKVGATRKPLNGLPQTDAAGKASFKVALDRLPDTTRPLQAQVVIRMAEPGGRAVERKLELPVVPAGPMIGVKPLFSGRSLGEGDQARFEVIVAAPDGSLLAHRGLRYELLRIDTRYQWYKYEGAWQFEPVESTRRVADGTFDVTADKPAQLSLPVSIGRYRLEVSSGDAKVPMTSLTFDAGWYAQATADTPDMLEIALDKPEYKPGDTMTVTVNARTAGRLTLHVIGDRLITTMGRDVNKGLNKFTLGVGRDWGTGAYVLATLRRPLDAEQKRMPGRAIGVQWFSIDRKAHTLAVHMQLPATVRPQTALRVPLQIDGLNAGEEARVVVAAVDVGILNLTNYQPPSADDFYLGQRRLTVEVRDLYGQLIDGMQGTRGKVRSGGDMAAAELQGSPPSQAPLALYSGILTVGADGKAVAEFNIPAFAGTVRVMAVAWSKDKVGHGMGDVIVRDPVVLTASLPRFLLTGDSSLLRLDLDNAEGAAGNYTLAVRSDGSTVVADGMRRTLQLQQKQRDFVLVPLNGSQAGDTKIDVQVTGPGGFSIKRSYALAVNPATHTVTRRSVRALAKGESIVLSGDLVADLVPGTGSVALSVGASPALDAAALLTALEHYPFGCSEQLTSRAISLLYEQDFAGAGGLPAETVAKATIHDAIERLLARQGANGSFGLWSAGGEDVWLDAYVTDFLSRARERGFAVPDAAFKLALARLRNFISYAPDLAKDGGRNLAYALYVLARNGAAPVGDLRYLADTKLDALATPIAKAQIAAALGMLGDKPRAERVYDAALQSTPQKPRIEIGRVDYGSALRDAAALVTLASEGGAPPATITKAVQRVEAARGMTRYTSTQEKAWLVLAARALVKEASAVSLTVADVPHQGALYRTVSARELAKGPLTVKNTGAGTVQAVVSVSGAPLVAEPPIDSGFNIERQFYTLDGEPADPAHAKQNQRFAVVLRITEAQPQFGRLIVADYLPAGFEIDNPRLVSSGDAGALPWIKAGVQPVHAEFRDDRFTAAFDRKKDDAAVFSVGYVVRAVTPGKYTLPQATVEDMYRPDRFGRTGSGTIEISAGR